MTLNYKINIFFDNKSWLEEKVFKSKRNLINFIHKISIYTLNGYSKKNKIKINFILSNDKLLKKLNKEFLKKEETTNVLSFPNDNFSKKNDNFLGEIFLSYEKCKKEAENLKIKEKDRIGHLIVHGILHLLGYDHKSKKDGKKMENVESKILKDLSINYY